MKKMISGIPIKLAYYAPHALRWKKIIQSLNLDLQKDTIVEIAPGWAPKIIMALHELSFKGTYIGIDHSREALNTLELMSDLLSPSFKIATLKPSQMAKIRNKANLIIANHVLDDFILRDYLLQKNKTSQQDVFSSINKLKNSWQEISKNENSYAQTSAEQLLSYLENLSIPGTKSLVSQYPAYLEKLYKLDQTTEISLKAFSIFSQNIIKGGWQKKALPTKQSPFNENTLKYLIRT